MKNKNKNKNCGAESSMILLYDGHLGDTIINGNTDRSGNIILEIRDLVLSYLHIGQHTHYENIGFNQAKQKWSQI